MESFHLLVSSIAATVNSHRLQTAIVTWHSKSLAKRSQVCVVRIGV
jgi:hypothetical protein